MLLMLYPLPEGWKITAPGGRDGGLPVSLHPLGVGG